jgi:branched-chain amino acid transport system ATP-binding protein
MAGDAILEVENVDLGYGTLKVVFGASLRVARGELVGLVGGNGSGKSTILRAVSGMIAPFSGRILFDGEQIRGARPHQMAAKGLAHVPMGRQLFPNMSVRENLLLGAYLPAARLNRAENLERVEGLFPDLAKQSAIPAGALSGGQQQMVAVGRALMARPDVLVLDELSLGLAPLVVAELVSHLRQLNAERGIAILLIEQNARLALDMCSRAYVLEAGRVALDGPSAELAGSHRVAAAYLGGGTGT